MLEIPIETGGNAHFTQTANVGGVSLAMRFLWNGRDGHWFADFESADGKNLGIRLVPFTPLLGTKNRCLPGGDLVIVPAASGTDATLGFGTLGTAFSLGYATQEEAETLAAAVIGTYSGKGG